MIKKTIFLLYSLLTIYSCNDNKPEYTAIKHTNLKNIKFTHLSYDTILLNGEGLSMEGHFVINNNKLLFCDEVFALIQIYDLDGKKLKRKLGRGPGPNEVADLYRVVSSNTQTGDFVILDKSWRVYLFNKKFERQSTSRIDFRNMQSMNDLYNNPDIENPGLYELEYFNATINSNGKLLLIPITTEHPKLNSFANNCTKYYRDSYLMALIDIESGKVKQLLGKRPPIYREYQYLPNFNFIKCLWIDDYIYYTTEIDPNIYIMDLDGRLTMSFGASGKEMATNYTETKTLNESESNFFAHRKLFGYYNFLKEGDGLIFRGYQKGGDATTDGMQVYKDKVLIADIDIPKGSEYIGYSAGYHFLMISMDNEKEYFMLGKFKLESHD